MTALKPYFITVYMLALMVTTVHSAIALIAAPPQWALWLAALVALLPMATLFGALFTKRIARTRANLPIQLTITALGAAAVLVLQIRHPQATLLPAFYALVVGLGGALAYVFWYSRFPGRRSDLLRIGAGLPEITLETPAGETVSTEDLKGRPIIAVFYRGNWCPLCMAQVNEIASQYSELAERGAEILLISPQPNSHSQELAERLNVPIRFLVDPGNRNARMLGLAANSTPFGMELLGYDRETVMPTVVVADANGKILFADQTDNYRVRPEPEMFLRILDQQGLQQAAEGAN